tara:strand:+ start:5656 stop:7026 length:1371 start_codon:yes stop_codon:yes gene_type:complete
MSTFANRRAYTVSDLTRSIRDALESKFGSVWVEGEISNLRLQSSGHAYFSLKDANAQIRCVQFRGNAANNPVPLRDGMQVQTYGEVTVYEAQGQYQIIVRTIQPRGMGELQARFEALKRKLEAEGLFQPARKQRIPKFPNTIALITSPTGAAVRDMLNILTRRAPWVRLIIVPVRVQGEGAAVEIAAALKKVSTEQSATFPKIDTIIVGRGGGSIEDLWNFNEEILARAIAECPIPVISAVGHEIDFTISDFVADLRAPTPSAAAELVVPDRAELLQHLARLQGRMESQLANRIRHWRKVLELLARSGAFREPGRVMADRRQRLDEFQARLNEGRRQKIAQSQDRIENAKRLLELSRPDRILEQRREWLAMLKGRLYQSALRQTNEKRQRLTALVSMVRTLGPDSVLSRGFSLTTDENGNLVNSAEQLNPGQQVVTRLASGEFDAEVREVRTKGKT